MNMYIENLKTHGFDHEERRGFFRTLVYFKWALIGYSVEFNLSEIMKMTNETYGYLLRKRDPVNTRKVDECFSHIHTTTTGQQQLQYEYLVKYYNKVYGVGNYKLIDTGCDNRGAPIFLEGKDEKSKKEQGEADYRLIVESKGIDVKIELKYIIRRGSFVTFKKNDMLKEDTIFLVFGLYKDKIIKFTSKAIERIKAEIKPKYHPNTVNKRGRLIPLPYNKRLFYDNKFPDKYNEKDIKDYMKGRGLYLKLKEEGEIKHIKIDKKIVEKVRYNNNGLVEDREFIYDRFIDKINSLPDIEEWEEWDDWTKLDDLNLLKTRFGQEEREEDERKPICTFA